MTDRVKRSYDASGRQEQARRTRRRIVAAATELFVDRGYAATSVASIARAAHVSPQTVYGAFGTKAALLSEAIGVAMAGDDEPVAVLDRPDAQAALTAPSPIDAATAFAAAATRLLVRAGRLLHAAEAAAASDPDLDRLRVIGHRARLTDMRRTADAFAERGFLRDGVDAARAADLLWMLASPDAFRACETIRGWSPDRYEDWLADALLAFVLRAPADE